MGDRPGMVNQGDSCVLNAIVQALFTSAQFRRSVLEFPSDHIHTEHGPHGCPLCCLRDLFVQLQENNSNLIDSSENLRLACEEYFGVVDYNVFAARRGVDTTYVFEYLFRAIHEVALGPPLPSDGSLCEYIVCPVHSVLSVRFETKVQCLHCLMGETILKTRDHSHLEMFGTDIGNLQANTCYFWNLYKNTQRLNDQDLLCLQCYEASNPYNVLFTQGVLVLKVHWTEEEPMLEEKTNALESISYLMSFNAGCMMTLNEPAEFSLFAMCCGESWHERCFAESENGWVMYDDELVDLIGSFSDMIAYCIDHEYGLSALFYERYYP